MTQLKEAVTAQAPLSSPLGTGSGGPFGLSLRTKPFSLIQLEVLHRLGYNGPDQIALFPPILLHKISTDLLLSCDPKDGNDLLAYYIMLELEAYFTIPIAVFGTILFGSALYKWRNIAPTEGGD